MRIGINFISPIISYNPMIKYLCNYVVRNSVKYYMFVTKYWLSVCYNTMVDIAINIAFCVTAWPQVRALRDFMQRCREAFFERFCSATFG